MPRSARSTPSPLLVLVVAIVGISFAASLVRLSHAHPLAVAVWRLFLSLVVIGTILIVGRGREQWRRLARGNHRCHVLSCGAAAATDAGPVAVRGAHPRCVLRHARRD